MPPLATYLVGIMYHEPGPFALWNRGVIEDHESSTAGNGMGSNGVNVTVGQPLVHDDALAATPDGGLAKSNAGTLTLTGANTYTGLTSVTGGTLLMNGTHANAGSYSIAAAAGSATLGGSGGTIALAAGNEVTIGANGILAPGSSIGTLNVGGSGDGVAFASGGALAAEVGAAGASDLLNVTSGTLDLSAANDTLSLVSPAGAFDGSTYTIATAAGGVVGQFDQLSVPNGVVANTTSFSINGFDYTVSYNPNSVVLAVPEPASLGLLSLGAIGLLARRRRVA